MSKNRKSTVIPFSRGWVHKSGNNTILEGLSGKLFFASHHLGISMYLVRATKSTQTPWESCNPQATNQHNPMHVHVTSNGIYRSEPVPPLTRKPTNFFIFCNFPKCTWFHDHFGEMAKTCLNKVRVFEHCRLNIFSRRRKKDFIQGFLRFWRDPNSNVDFGVPAALRGIQIFLFF